LLNEAESLPELVEWIVRVMNNNNFSYEIILIDDGSTDNSWQVIESLKNQYTNVKAIKFLRNYGKAAALQVGFTEAQGNVVITMDADLQDSPDEIPALYRMITEEKYDLVSGWKKVRHDAFFSKRLPSKLYNWTVKVISGIPLHDMNCGLKAYRNQVVKSIEVYGDMHRYIPVLAKWAGFKKIGEKVVVHQKRKYGKSKFGIERFIRGPLDLISVSFITRFGRRPMHFFGILGTLMFLIGGAVSFYLLAEKVYKSWHNIPTRDVTDQPLFYLALLAIILGVQLFLAGFLAELITRNAVDRNKYLIEKRL
jgi:glycosyltransferase involved in cell wall biosynthesis